MGQAGSQARSRGRDPRPTTCYRGNLGRLEICIPLKLLGPCTAWQLPDPCRHCISSNSGPGLAKVNFPLGYAELGWGSFGWRFRRFYFPLQRDNSLSEVKRWRACLGDAEVVKLLPRCGYMAHSTVSLRGGKAVSLSLCSLG